MSSGAWFAWFGVISVVALPLAEYFIHRVRKDAPDLHRWAGSPKGGSVLWQSPPHLGYISLILSRRYVQSLTHLPRLRRLADALFLLHFAQFVTLIAGVVSSIG